jgi:hypothetical protein
LLGRPFVFVRRDFGARDLDLDLDLEGRREVSHVANVIERAA